MPSKYDQIFSMAMKANEGECVEWPFSRDKHGYGLAGGWGKRAHRIAFKMLHGEILPGNVVMHDCDNPSCINPRHLKQGTQAENISDMVAKGRDSRAIPDSVDNRGECHGKAKLTNEDVLKIRKAVNMGEKQKALAEKFQITKQTISDIVLRKRWSHLI